MVRAGRTRWCGAIKNRTRRQKIGWAAVIGRPFCDQEADFLNGYKPLLNMWEIWVLLSRAAATIRTCEMMVNAGASTPGFSEVRVAPDQSHSNDDGLP